MLRQGSVIHGRISLDDSSGSPKIDVYVMPDEAECECLLQEFKLDAHTLKSAMDPNEMPRVEFEQDHAAIILKYPKPYSEGDEFHFVVNSFGLFLFSSERVISIFNEVLPFARLPGSRNGASVEQINTVQDFLLCMLSQAIRRFEINLKLINSRKNELTKSINQIQKSKNLTDMFSLREGLIYYIDALRGNGHLIERLLAASEKLGFSQENVEILKDYAIENQQFLEQAQEYSLVLSDLMDACNTIISNNLNTIMKNMNSLVIAISVPAFFTGLGGMSEFTLFISPNLKWYIAYPLFLMAMALLSFCIYRLIQRYYRT